MAFHPLANLAQLQDGQMRACSVGGHSLLLIQQDNRHYLLENRCPHMDAPLHTGTLEGELLRCRAHGLAFSLRDGRARGPLASVCAPLRLLPVAYDGNRIGVDLPL